MTLREWQHVICDGSPRTLKKYNARIDDVEQAFLVVDHVHKSTRRQRNVNPIADTIAD